MVRHYVVRIPLEMAKVPPSDEELSYLRDVQTLTVNNAIINEIPLRTIIAEIPPVQMKRSETNSFSLS